MISYICYHNLFTNNMHINMNSFLLQVRKSFLIAKVEDYIFENIDNNKRYLITNIEHIQNLMMLQMMLIRREIRQKELAMEQRILMKVRDMKISRY